MSHHSFVAGILCNERNLLVVLPILHIEDILLGCSSHKVSHWGCCCCNIYIVSWCGLLVSVLVVFVVRGVMVYLCNILYAVCTMLSCPNNLLSCFTHVLCACTVFLVYTFSVGF